MREGRYYVVADRWQTFTETVVGRPTLEWLARFCDEFLVHAVDVEGKRCGLDATLVELLARECPIPVTYAGGIASVDDLETVRVKGRDRIDATVGSALDIFGGSLSYEEVVRWHRAHAG
jgi:phosphoribosylformimino-5-aminoimidazole carboxamide ribotide isomerase